MLRVIGKGNVEYEFQALQGLYCLPSGLLRYMASQSLSAATEGHT